MPPPPPIGEPPEEPRRRRRWLLGCSRALARNRGRGCSLFVLSTRPGQTSVPLVVGPDARQRARPSSSVPGLQVDVRRRADRAPRDIVFDQAPNPGEKADDGSTVAVFVSNGPGTVKVPDVVGLTEADAKRRVRAAALAPAVRAGELGQGAGGDRDPLRPERRPPSGPATPPSRWS